MSMSLVLAIDLVGCWWLRVESGNMPNDEWLMTNQGRSSNDEFGFCHWDFPGHSELGIHGSFGVVAWVVILRLPAGRGRGADLCARFRPGE